MTALDHVDRALDGERVFDIGQLSPGTLQELNRLVRFGVLTKRSSNLNRIDVDGNLTAELRTAYELSLPNNLRKAS